MGGVPGRFGVPLTPPLFFFFFTPFQGRRDLCPRPGLQQLHPAAQPAHERGRGLAGHHAGEGGGLWEGVLGSPSVPRGVWRGFGVPFCPPWDFWAPFLPPHSFLGTRFHPHVILGTPFYPHFFLGPPSTPKKDFGAPSRGGGTHIPNHLSVWGCTTPCPPSPPRSPQLQALPGGVSPLNVGVLHDDFFCAPPRSSTPWTPCSATATTWPRPWPRWCRRGGRCCAATRWRSGRPPRPCSSRRPWRSTARTSTTSGRTS